MEDQIGALGLVLDALVLFNTRYTDAAVAQIREDGFEIRDEDVARLSPFVRHHNNVYLDTSRNLWADRHRRSPPDPAAWTAVELSHVFPESGCRGLG